MRIKTTICIILIFTGLLVAFLHLPSDPPVLITFQGYADWDHYSDGSRAARFALTNNTSRWLDSSPGLAQIQIKTVNGWTNFVSDSPDHIIKLSGWDGAKPHENWWILLPVPQNQAPWRLHVSYTMRGQQWTRLVFLKYVVSVLNAGDKEYDVYSQEMTNEPAR